MITLIKEMKTFLKKILIVILPCGCKFIDTKEIEWDISGPFLMILLLGILMTFSNKSNESYFVTVFCFLGIGSFFVTVNAQLQSLNCSYYELLNIFCFCIFPIFLEDMIIYLLDIKDNYLLTLIILLAGYSWSVFAVGSFIWNLAEPGKNFIIIFPAFLVYTLISFLNSWNLL